jgi:hypothetical protein
VVTPPPETQPAHVEAPPPKPADPLVEAFRCFREGKAREAREHLREVDPSSREVLAVLLPLAARLAELCKDGKPDDFSSTVDRLERLARALRPNAALTLEKLCYCRRVQKFGVYDPLPDDHAFQAAGERPGDLVQVYVELRNFCCQKTGKFNETALAYVLEIYNNKNELVWRQDRPAEVEHSLSPRRDGHLICYFCVPQQLQPGDYTLCIHVKDVTGLTPEQVPAHRVARRSLPFRVRNSLVRAGD